MQRSKVESAGAVWDSFIHCKSSEINPFGFILHMGLIVPTKKYCMEGVESHRIHVWYSYIYYYIYHKNQPFVDR